MKRLPNGFVRVALLCIFGLIIRTSLPAAPIAHWTFNDPSLGAAHGAAMPDSDGQTVWRQAVMDQSGNGNHLTTWDHAWAGFNWTNDSYKGDFGMIAAGSYPASMTWSEQSLPSGVDIETWTPPQFTIEAIFKPSADGYRTIVGRDGRNGDAASLYFQQIPGWGVSIKFVDIAGNFHDVSSTGNDIAQNTWYHMAAVSDGTTLTLYLKNLSAGTPHEVLGTADLSASADSRLRIGDGTGTGWEAGTFTVGRGLWQGGHTDRFLSPGVIDEVRISDTALTPTEFLVSDLIIFTESEGKTLLYAGDTTYTDSYDIELLAAPTDNVLVTVTPPAGIDAGSGSGQNHVLIFTPSNWTPQTVTLRIVDPQLGESVLPVAHTCQSNDLNYNGVTIRNINVQIAEDACGIWGYLEADYNLDCSVNLEDFALLGALWLQTDAPLDIEELAADWLADTMQYDESIFARSIQRSTQPFFVNTAQTENTIDEKVYGHFLEHIYHSANGGLWGEMVWNRSFEISGSGGGEWSIEGDELVQSSLATDVRLTFGDTAWQDYELTLQAKKTGGSEGFLIPFRYADGDNFYWLNLGGWGNSRHAVEKEINGSRGTVSGTSVSGSITADQWYDIRIRCQNGSFEIFLNNSSIISFTDNSNPHLSGQVGVGTWATQARFRNIQVTRIPNGSVLFSGLPAVTGTAFTANFWSTVGNVQAFMSTDALNDDKSAGIGASGAGAGLVQNNFKFIAQTYTGSVWMKGSLPAGVKVELLDGSTVLGQAVLGAPTSNWTEYPFQIASSGSSNQGSLRITTQGPGTVFIDQVSLMGQDAIDVGGYRPDLLSAVEGLRPPIIRWPGGCFASLYLWKDGIGPQHTRKRYSAYMWEDQDTNSYGTDEFLRMCERIGAEPLICINTGVLNSACGAPAQWKLSPDTTETYVQYTLDWMEYCNGSIATPMGALRAANGHPEPYNVTFWEIDNETWDAGSAAYIARVQAFAPAMQAKAAELGVPIKISAVGSGGYDQSWNQAIIDACATLIDYISVHYYESPDGFKSGPASYENYLIDLGNYIASSANPDMKIYNSEWNAQSTDWRTGLFAGGILNVFERQGDVFEIGGPALFLRHTSAGGWDNAFINFDHTGWFAAPNYVVMKLWYDHFAPTRVHTEGSDTNLNVVSTLSEDEQTLYLKIVNADNTAKSVEYEIDSSFVPESAYMHYVAPGDLYARNTLADPSAVGVQAKVVGFKGQTLLFRLPAYSAGVVTVKTSKPHRTKYLYSSFRNNGEDGLHLAYSDNGLTFTALKNDQSFLTPAVGSNLMRDPSICQGPDGMFHLVWTTGWWDKGIGIAHSADLINWSSQTFLPVMAHEANAKNCWAPEIFYDEATKRFLIFWSTTIDPASNDNHRIYFVSTQDFVTYTDTALFYDPGFNCIDAFIAKDGDRYAMVLKDERNPGKNIRITFSDNAAGPYDVPPSDAVTPGGLWVEGPSLIKVGQEWMLYYDAYTSGYMGGQSSTDLATWTDKRSAISFPSGTRHGTVFAVTQDVVDTLRAL